AVYTQPDRPSGRGRKLTPPPVKVLAEEHEIPVFQPPKLRAPDAVEQLREIKPDLIVVVAFGQILPKSVLEIPEYGCINVHASLLPRYRGAAPIHRAIIDGEESTGITTMLMDEGLDTGDMLVKKSLAIGPEETAGELHYSLALLGHETMVETLARLCTGTLEPEPQDDEKSSYAPMLKKEDGRIDWNRSAEEIHNQVRGLDPWPGAYTRLDGKDIKLFGTSPLKGGGEPGTVLSADPEGVRIACGEGVLLCRELQLPGKKRLPAADFVRGRTMVPGTRLEF
ncbi:MAG TPA: methionyl-tRNA formyltransferase, partial [Desulfuromonadales bacterium]|nr:methionyl-tRNA formyltransferase [Desulfuromonadales bacterium]